MFYAFECVNCRDFPRKLCYTENIGGPESRRMASKSDSVSAKPEMEGDMNDEEEKKHFAVLIDADNISEKYASSIFNEIADYGYASYRRIYGNWAKGNGWKEDTLLENSINPIQQFNYTIGKNATDMAMVIDAMDILYSGKVDGFCLVTSDSDFTKLAMRLREAQMYVIGMGESKTPLALTKACNKFIRLDLISGEMEEKSAESPKASGGGRKHKASAPEEKQDSTVTPISEIEESIITFVQNNENKGKPTYLGEVGSRLGDKFIEFDARNYGYTKLVTLLRDKCPKLTIIQEGTSYRIELKEQAGEEALEKEIIAFLKKNGGKVDNLSLVLDHLKKKHPQFNVSDYGYNRVSSFLRSFDKISVHGNALMLKEG